MGWTTQRRSRTEGGRADQADFSDAGLETPATHPLVARAASQKLWDVAGSGWRQLPEENDP